MVKGIENSKERQVGLLQETMQRNRRKQQKGRLAISSRKLEISKEHLIKDGPSKAQKR